MLAAFDEGRAKTGAHAAFRHAQDWRPNGTTLVEGLTLVGPTEGFAFQPGAACDAARALA